MEEDEEEEEGGTALVADWGAELEEEEEEEVEVLADETGTASEMTMPELEAMTKGQRVWRAEVQIRLVVVMG